MPANTSKMQTFSVDNTPENWVKDPKGYFLIRVDRENKKIEAGFCEQVNKVKYHWVAAKARDIYLSIIRKNLDLKPGHVAYLAKELYKAQIALENKVEYVQDEDLNLKKKWTMKQ